MKRSRAVILMQAIAAFGAQVRALRSGLTSDAKRCRKSRQLPASSSHRRRTYLRTASHATRSISARPSMKSTLPPEHTNERSGRFPATDRRGCMVTMRFFSVAACCMVTQTGTGNSHFSFAPRWITVQQVQTRVFNLRDAMRSFVRSGPMPMAKHKRLIGCFSMVVKEIPWHLQPGTYRRRTAVSSGGPANDVWSRPSSAGNCLPLCIRARISV